MIRLSRMVKGSGKAVAQDAAPKKQQTLQEHLKQYHGGKMPKGKCKFLKQYEQEHPEEFKAAEAEVAIENADKNKKVIPNTQRFAKPEDYDKANAEGITAIKDWINGDDKMIGDITQAYTRSEYPNGEKWQDVDDEWDEFVGDCPEIEDEDKVEEAAKELDKRLRMWNKAKMFNGAFNGIKTNIDDAEDDAIVRELGTRADLLDALKKNGLNRKEAQYAFLLGQVEDIANAAADNNLLYKEDGSIDMGLFANDRILDMSEDDMKAEFKNAETNADKWFGKETSNGEGDNGSGKEGEEERIKNLSDEDLANEIARERANLRHPSLASSRSTIKENVARLEQEQKNRSKNGGKKDEKNDANADGNKNANANGGASADPLDAVQSAIWSELSKRDEIKDMDCDVLGDGKLTLGFKMIRGGQFGESAKALLGNALKKMGLSAENIENVSDDGKGSATVTVNTNGKSSQDLKDSIEGKSSDEGAKLKNSIMEQLSEVNWMIDNPENSALSSSELQAQMAIVCRIAKSMGIDAQVKEYEKGKFFAYIDGKVAKSK